MKHGQRAYWRERRERIRQGLMPPEMEAKLDKVREYVRGRKTITSSQLIKRFKLNWQTTGDLLAVLEQEGIVAPRNGKRPREVYNPPRAPLGRALVPYSSSQNLEERLKKVERFIAVVGESAEIATVLRSLIDDVRRLEKVRQALEQ